MDRHELLSDLNAWRASCGEDLPDPVAEIVSRHNEHHALRSALLRATEALEDVAGRTGDAGARLAAEDARKALGN